MIEYKLNPRFNDTDALGHINNATVATWFEEGRKEIFRFFVPTLSPQDWNLILARIEIDYLAQGSYQHEVMIKSFVEKIGTSSFTISQECHQNGKMIAKGKAILVHFDYASNGAKAIPTEIRKKLEAHLVSAG